MNNVSNSVNNGTEVVDIIQTVTSMDGIAEKATSSPILAARTHLYGTRNVQTRFRGNLICTPGAKSGRVRWGVRI